MPYRCAGATLVCQAPRRPDHPAGHRTEGVLRVERRPRRVGALDDGPLDDVLVAFERLELVDQHVDVHLMDVVAVPGELHLAHQG